MCISMEKIQGDEYGFLAEFDAFQSYASKEL